METKNIDINIQAAIPASRGIGSMVGSLVGQAYHKVESRNTWQGGDQGWDNDNEKVRQGVSTMLIPNRPIKKYMLKWRHVHPSFTGEDLIEIGVEPGPQMRTLLTGLRAACLDLGLGPEEETEWLERSIEKGF